MDLDNYDEFIVRIYRGRRAQKPTRKDLYHEYHEYHEFLREVYYRYLHSILIQGFIREIFAEWDDLLDNFLRANWNLRILEGIRSESDLPWSDRIDIAEITRILWRGFQIHNQLVAETEIADILEDYFVTIVNSLQMEDFPEEDFELLEKAGSLNARRELPFLIHQLKDRQQQILAQGRNKPFSIRLKEAERALNEERNPNRMRKPGSQPKAPQEEKATKKRWFKALGGIGSGVLLTMADIGKSVASIHTGAPLDVYIPGIMESTATGLGTLFNGIGDMRDE